MANSTTEKGKNVFVFSVFSPFSPCSCTHIFLCLSSPLPWQLDPLFLTSPIPTTLSPLFFFPFCTLVGLLVPLFHLHLLLLLSFSFEKRSVNSELMKKCDRKFSKATHSYCSFLLISGNNKKFQVAVLELYAMTRCCVQMASIRWLVLLCHWFEEGIFTERIDK